MRNDHPISRRTVLAAAGALPLLMSMPRRGHAEALPLVSVSKDPSCGCCDGWVAHIEAAGFPVKVVESSDMDSLKQRLGVPAELASCHTAEVGGYVVEGHVHADDVHRLLRDKPQALGLAVPGMPVGSPGMDGPAYGGRRDAYDTLLVQRDGGSQVFRRHV